MINNSKFCVIHYDEDAVSTSRKSGTKIVLDYAIKNKKKIIVLATEK